jgi:hypothetical protein
LPLQAALSSLKESQNTWANDRSIEVSRLANRFPDFVFATAMRRQLAPALRCVAYQNSRYG